MNIKIVNDYEEKVVINKNNEKIFISFNPKEDVKNFITEKFDEIFPFIIEESSGIFQIRIKNSGKINKIYYETFFWIPTQSFR